MIPKVRKQFDCVEMKRRLQERIYEETRGMTPAQRVAHAQARIAKSRFAAFLRQPGGSAGVSSGS